MNKLHLEYALALAKYKNFTIAARNLYVTQPAFSKQIAALEKEIGLTLFLRTSRSVELTMAGETMITAFKNIQNIYNQAISQASVQSANGAEHLHIGFIKEQGDKAVLTQALKKMIQIYPNADFRFESVISSDIPYALEAGLFDVIITIDRDVIPYKDVQAIPIYYDDVAIMITASHPLARSQFFDMDAFHQTGLPVIVTRELADFDHFCADVCKTFNVDIASLYPVPNIESMFSAVEAGLGVMLFSITPRVVSNPAIRYFDLNREKIPVVIGWKKKNKNPLIQTFVDLMKLEVDQNDPLP